MGFRAMYMPLAQFSEHKGQIDKWCSEQQQSWVRIVFREEAVNVIGTQVVGNMQ